MSAVMTLPSSTNATRTHVKQVLLWALFGCCCCQAFCHILPLCLEGCKNLGVNLLSVHIGWHLRFLGLTFTFGQADYIKWPYSRQWEKQLYTQCSFDANLQRLKLFSYPVEWRWAFCHLPSFHHSVSLGNMFDLYILGPSNHIIIN